MSQEENAVGEAPACPKPGSWGWPSPTGLIFLLRAALLATSHVFQEKHFKQTVVCKQNVSARVFSDSGVGSENYPNTEERLKWGKHSTINIIPIFPEKNSRLGEIRPRSHS